MRVHGITVGAALAAAASLALLAAGVARPAPADMPSADTETPPQALGGTSPMMAGAAVPSPDAVPAPAEPSPSTAAPAPVFRIAAAGDIACDPASAAFRGGRGSAAECRQAATADLLAGGGFDAVLTLGDHQYESGSLSGFQRSYDLSWGRFLEITHPVPGNHDYATPGAAGYFHYFGAAAGDPARGYYSYDLGDWHLVALNSNCFAAGGCGAGSPQERWLRADLAAHPARCTLAYWHHPRFSSGPHGSDIAYAAFWQALYDAGADLVLSGHDHTYERFAPQTAAGELDEERGVRQFVVGTGGRIHYGFAAVRPNSEVRNSATYGVLALTLAPDTYSWEFLPEAGGSFTDAGSQRCRNA